MNNTLILNNVSSNGIHPSSMENYNVFIEANTKTMTYNEMKANHIIPVFVKDNEPVISHTDFIDITLEAAKTCFPKGEMNLPNVRVSHPIKGRIPDAKGKPAKELEEWEKTLYYERMAFMVEFPNMREVVNGQNLTLTIGGVKAYNQDNLYSTKGSYEHFKVFIGFKNTVCTNLSISTDGFKGDLKVRSIEQLYQQILELFKSYNAMQQLAHFFDWCDLYLSETQFAQLVGRARLYNLLPYKEKSKLPVLLMNDSQVTTIARQYYKDDNFSRRENGSIHLWSLYNLFTGANKSSYIDTFLDRGVNAMSFIQNMATTLREEKDFWFLS